MQFSIVIVKNMSRWKMCFCGFVLLLSCCSMVYGAQSTSDVPVTPEMIEKARGQVLGGTDAADLGEKEYVVGYGDVLSVQVYGEGDMSAAKPSSGSTEKSSEISGVQVRIDGRISLKHLGDIEAVGFNLTQLADYLKTLYSLVYGDPIITVVLVKSNSQRYTVMGKVLRPGIFSRDFPINIVQVIARCGGFTEWAKSEIILIRDNPTVNRKLFKGNKLTFDYDDFLDGKKLEKNVLIQPDDIIVVN